MIARKVVLESLAARITDEIVITTMSAAVPWAHLSDRPQDLAHVDSAMGYAPSVGLGIALARPDRRVLVLNGDGSMRMGLSALVTIAALRARNLLVAVIDNGVYEVTGGQPVPGADASSLACLARAAGFRCVYEFDTAETLKDVPAALKAEGPVFLAFRVQAASEPAPARKPSHESLRFRHTLAEEAHALREWLSAN